MNHCLQIASPLDRFISLLERLDDSSNRLLIGLRVGKDEFQGMSGDTGFGVSGGGSVGQGKSGHLDILGDKMG